MAFDRRRGARAERATGGREDRVFEQGDRRDLKQGCGFSRRGLLPAKNVAHGVWRWHLTAGGDPG
jgi:hypothetical protein